MAKSTDSTDPSQRKVTLSHLVGEAAWIFSQSISHKSIPIGDISARIIVPIMEHRFYIFRHENRPAALAIWGNDTSDQEEARNDPRSHSLRLSDLAIVDAVRSDEMIGLLIIELVLGPLRGKAFKAHPRVLGRDAEGDFIFPRSLGEQAEDRLRAFVMDHLGGAR